MLKIEKTVLPSPEQWEIVVEGMRNPKNSWDRIDSYKTFVVDEDTKRMVASEFFMGEKDHALANSLSLGGPVHAKYRRMLPVWVTITAPLYWWKEFETYRNGIAPNPNDIEMNSCSTMHKIHEREFTLEDFSCDHLLPGTVSILQMSIDALNAARARYVSLPKDDPTAKDYWWQMIQLLPRSYNQKRTIMLNYEALSNMYRWRRPHKLDEWHVFCDWIEELPYSELITGEREYEMEK